MAISVSYTESYLRNRHMAYWVRTCREGMRQLAELRRRLAAAESELADAQAAKQAPATGSGSRWRRCRPPRTR
jgi:hypothetical protein